MKAHVVVEKEQLTKRFLSGALVALVAAAFVGLIWTTMLEAHQENRITTTRPPHGGIT